MFIATRHIITEKNEVREAKRKHLPVFTAYISCAVTISAVPVDGTPR